MLRMLLEAKVFLSEEYYELSSGMSLDDVIRRWQVDGDRLYDDSMPMMVPVKALWRHREYTRTRDKSRDGPLAWDAIKKELKSKGWSNRKPLQLQVGRKGGVKVAEGNHRLAISRELRIKDVPVFVHFFSGRV